MTYISYEAVVLLHSENARNPRECPDFARRREEGVSLVFRNLLRYIARSRAVCAQFRITEPFEPSENAVKEGIEMKSNGISTARIPTGMNAGWSHVLV